MKNVTLVLFIVFSFINSLASAEELILCIKTKTIPVYAQDLKTIAFEAQQYETALPFQSFGQKNNPRSEYTHVELTDREDEDADQNTGWVKTSALITKSKCAGYKEPALAAEPDRDQDEKSKPVLSGLAALKNCFFPMKKRPTESYTEGMRKFGARRSKGTRAHAAADLYQSSYQPVYAIADGQVLRDRVSFYLGTNVTEIKHKGGFIARYGEIASAQLKPLKIGTTVKAGQLIGYIKKVNSRAVKSPMLHFELYTGKGSGPLTTRKGPFQRRSDLINPTQYLAMWEKIIK